MMAGWIAPALSTGWSATNVSGARQAPTKLSDLFHPDATYLASPWEGPVTGLDAIEGFWEAEREGADEAFTMSSEVVAVDGGTAVVRVSVEYADPAAGRWRDLWVLRFADDGRCASFEEWPFAPR
jgi:hypothetical protein